MHIFNFYNVKKEKKKRKLRVAIFFRITACFLVLSFLILSPAFLFDRNLYKQDINEFFNMNLDTTVLSLVHVETFEGSLSSRAKYLEKQIALFNKTKKDVYITVKTLTPEELKTNFEKDFCDIVSFGFGVGEFLKENLVELKNIKIKKEFLNSAKVDNKILAYPYSFGGYVAITRETNLSDKNIGEITIKDKNKKEYSLGFAKNGFINIAGALTKNNISTPKNLFYENNLSTYKMYENFLSNKFATLVGTTRDVVRCKDREIKGSLTSCCYKYLGGYTDLVQYMGITSTNLKKIAIAQEFLEFMIKEENQKSLNKVGLFSCVVDNIYTEGYLKEFEEVLSKDLVVPNAFLSTKEIENLKMEDFKKVVYEI